MPFQPLVTAFRNMASLPLLTKELIEQSHSKRMYILRVLYAVILYGFALWQYDSITGGASGGGFVNLGRGHEFFTILVDIQKFAIYLLLPAITCGAVTVEKEKDTLGLLLLTKLGPMTIVVEKLLSRVIAMGTYQLLSLPLFAIVYGIGGVELSGLIAAIIELTALSIAVASVSILCSTWFRTTSEAFIMTYVLVLSIAGCVQFDKEILASIQMRSNSPFATAMPSLTQTLMAPILIAIQSFVFSGIFVLIASRTLFRRAFVSPKNILLGIFQSVDRFFNALNDSTTGGIVLVKDREGLPLFQPISWRETRKRSLGTFRYQFRILTLLLTPLIFVIAAVLSEGRVDFTSPFRGFPVYFWLVAMICVTIHSTGVIAAERMRQSLDVLLVAPLTASEIVSEKLAGVRRLIKILIVPFAVLVTFQAIWSGYVMPAGSTLNQTTDFWLELVSSSLAPLVFMPVLMWVGFHFGLRLRSQMQAILATVAAVLVICLLPLAIAKYLDLESLALSPGVSRWNRAPWSVCLSWISPLRSMFETNNFGMEDDFGFYNAPNVPIAIPVKFEMFRWVSVTIHFVFYGLVWACLRQYALNSFSRVVKRSESQKEER